MTYCAAVSLASSSPAALSFYTGVPLWPFGYSGSYTTWQMAWEAPLLPRALSVGELRAGVLLSLAVRNAGSVDSAKALLFFSSVSLSAGASFRPPRKSLFAVSKVWVPRARAGQAWGSTLSRVTVRVNSSNLLGACAFCTVDEDGVAAVRPGRYTITVGDASASAVAPAVTTAS